MALFEGFQRRHVQVGEVSIHCVSGGQGDPVLLLHGYPQTLSEWALLAPLLAEKHTVVCADLRGYGDSSKPAGLPDHSTYAFRARAADQVGLMRALETSPELGIGQLPLDWPMAQRVAVARELLEQRVLLPVL